MKKLTIEELKEIIKRSGFKLVYNLEERDFYLVADYYVLAPSERIVE